MEVRKNTAFGWKHKNGMRNQDRKRKLPVENKQQHHQNGNNHNGKKLPPWAVPKRNGTISSLNNQNGFKKPNDATPTNGQHVNGAVVTPQTPQFSRIQLPIDAVEHQLMYELANNDTLIIIGETGSGKSTQVPQLCLRSGCERVAVTEPRRVAAVSLATRVSTEMGSTLGQKVGYHVRFENVTSDATKIEYMTDGIVLRKALMSPLLEKYSTIILDEAHERSLHSDVLMCILRQCQEQRKGTSTPLRLIIMSATLQADKFQKYFNNAKVLVVSGRTYPIEIFHAAQEKSSSFSSSDYVYNAVVTAKTVHLNEPSGHDILLFLTGSEEIEAVTKQLLDLNSSLPANSDAMMPIPLFAALRPEQQKLVFRPTPKGCRKIVVSTNIAETSITIPGIRVVIDCGKVKMKSFDAENRIDVLKVQSISKAQASQRAGRAGRMAPGKCYRLYTSADLMKFDEENTPEILRCNLAASFLELMKLGMKNPHKLKLIERPEKKNVDAALLELMSLGAIRPLKTDWSKFQLTEMGVNYCLYPLSPDHSRILVNAQKEGCVMEAIKIVAAMQVDPLWNFSSKDMQTDVDIERVKRRFETKEGDHITLLKLVLSTNQFFEQLNKTTEGDARFGKTEISLKREYGQNIKKFCAENFLNEQNLKMSSMIEDQLMNISKERKVPFSTCGSEFVNVRKSLAVGLFLNSCEFDRQEDRYRLMVNPAITLKIHPSSCLSRSKPSFIVFSQLMRTNDLYAMQVSLIEADWVRPLIRAHKSMRQNYLGESYEDVEKLIVNGTK